MDIDTIKELITLLKENQLTKIVFKRGDNEVLLEKERSVSRPMLAAATELIAPSETIKKDDGCYIESPMVGTFFASPAPDQPSFVKVGDRVQKDSVVCIIEAMKVMNEVKANAEGVIKEMLIENGQPVEYGTKLFRIE